jgi:hypothetical protein
VRTTAIARLDTWLRRLVGRFRISEVNGVAVKRGLQDCIAIGAGPGVHCLIGPGAGEQKYTGAPTMTLYGIDTQALKVSYLQVNSESIAEGALGRLSGDSITFAGECPRPAHTPSPPSPNGQHEPIILSCSLQLRIYAPAQDKYVMLETRKEMRALISTMGGMTTVVMPSTVRLRLERVPQTAIRKMPDAAPAQDRR